MNHPKLKGGIVQHIYPAAAMPKYAMSRAKVKIGKEGRYVVVTAHG